MRKFAAIIFASLLVYGSGLAMQVYQPLLKTRLPAPNIDLAQVMADTGALLLEATVDAWCPVQVSVKSPEDAGHVLAKVLKNMGLKDLGPIQLESIDADEEFGEITMCEAKIKTELPSGVILMGAVQSTENEGQQDTYLMLSLYDKSAAPNLAAMYDLLLRGAQAIGSKPEHATQLVGVLEGRLGPERVAELVSQIMAGTAAETKNIYQSGNLVSATGYSPLLDNKDVGSPELVNVNLAMRYNVEDDKTLIYLGSPSIWESI